MGIIDAGSKVSHAKLQQFLNRWPREAVAGLSLETYSHVGDSDTFTYWLEYGSEEIGVISGSSSMSKYGVWSRKSDTTGRSPRFGENDMHKWEKKYGADPLLAFVKVKTLILEVIDHSAAGKFELIDRVPLNSLIKWKIGFIYSACRLLPIYKSEVVRNLAKHFEHVDYFKAPLSELHQHNLSFKEPEEDIFDFSSRYFIFVNRPSKINYYVIGSKYEDQHGGGSYDVFPEMLIKNAVSTGFFWKYDFSALVGAEHSKIDQWARKNIPASTDKFNASLRTLKYFLNLKKGDIIAVKSHGRFSKLTIVGYAVVKEVNGSVYAFGDGELGHLIHVDFLECGLNIMVGLNYAKTIHRIIPGEKPGHFEKIFGSYAITDLTEEFEDEEEYTEHEPEVEDDYDQDDIRDKNEQSFTRSMKESQVVQQVHNTIQNRFARFLKQRYPADRVKTERSRIDIWRRSDSGFFIYEVKPYQTVYACIREALGQLTDYAFSKASTKPTHLIVVGTAKPQGKDLSYIGFLRSNLGLPFTYECFSMKGNTSISYPVVKNPGSADIGLKNQADEVASEPVDAKQNA
jgi:hypothetical protein